MELRKASETATKMVIEWDAVPGATAGYRGRVLGAPKWTQTQGTQMTFAKDAEVEVQALGVIGSGVYPSLPEPEPEPEPGTYTYRFATFNPSTDKVTGCLNRFPPTYSWWQPGSTEGGAWPKGGGIFPTSHPTYGTGFKTIVTDEMLYGNASAGPKDSNVVRVAIEPKNRTFFPAGNPLEIPVPGTTHEWAATYMYPGGSWSNRNYESMWELFGTHNGINSVYHHLYHRVSGGAHNYYIGRQHAPPTENPPQTYIWTQHQCSIPWSAGDYHSIRWQIKWSSPGVSNGSFKAWTSVNGGPEQQWMNALNVPTILSGFQSCYAAGHFGIRAPLGTPKLEMHVYNLQVTIT